MMTCFSNKNIRLVDLSSAESLKREVEAFKGYLVSLNDNAAMKKMSLDGLDIVTPDIVAPKD